MPTYSVNGYLIALRQRSRRTILVEGVTDKRLLHKLVHEVADRKGVNISHCDVDTAQIIDGFPPGISGNREKVEYVYEQAKINGLNLAAMVDREYRGFNMDASISDEFQLHRVIDGNMFWTRGHSIENYFLDSESIVQILMSRFSHIVPAGCRSRVEAYFNRILFLSAAASLALWQAALLDNSKGLFTYIHWILGNDGYPVYNIPEMEQALSSRHVDANQIQSFTRGLSRFIAILPPMDSNLHRWICHGHVGYELAWGGIARLFENDGLTGNQLGEIAHHWKDEKEHQAADYWAKTAISGTDESPVALLSWIIG